MHAKNALAFHAGVGERASKRARIEVEASDLLDALVVASGPPGQQGPPPAGPDAAGPPAGIGRERPSEALLVPPGL